MSDILTDGREGWADCMARWSNSGPFGAPAWGAAIVGAYGLDAYCLMARQNRGQTSDRDDLTENTMGMRSEVEGGCGVLPLVHVKHWLFGNGLVAMPFCDGGAGAAADADIESALISGALDLASQLGVPVLELRCFEPLACAGVQSVTGSENFAFLNGEKALSGWYPPERVDGNKVRMVLDLPGSEADLMRSFKAKLRSQINKPIKAGLTVRLGGVELLDDFYRVFVENMRDLGSPVHSKKFISQVLLGFGESARLFVVYREGLELAGSVTLNFGGVMYNPWASSLRRHSNLAPNMYLYWSMLAHACRQRCAQFDFGRSTVGEGTYRFKEQWGARPAPLYWYRFERCGGKRSHRATDSGGLELAAGIWRRLPISATRVIGPRIRRYISL